MIGAPDAALANSPDALMLSAGTKGMIAPTTPRIGFTVPSIGVTIPVITGVMISVTTERGRLTPEQALTRLVGGATCA